MDKIIQKEDGKLLFHCPGCNRIHILNDPNYKPRWGFNCDLEKPTIRPSILCEWEYGPAENRTKHVCHSFVTDGKIEFRNDCTHDLAGETVDLLDVNKENYNLDLIRCY